MSHRLAIAGRLLLTALGCREQNRFTVYPMHPTALTLPGLLALAVLLLHQWRSDWNILGIICLLAPSLSVVTVLIRRDNPRIRLRSHIERDLPGMRNELCLFLATGIMAALNLYAGFVMT